MVVAFQIEAPGPLVLPVFGLSPTKAITELLARHDEEHTFECGWIFIRQDTHAEAWLDMEFVAPVYARAALRFQAADATVMEALIGNGGCFGLAIDQDAYKRGEVIEITDVALDVPQLFLTFLDVHKCRIDPDIE